MKPNIVFTTEFLEGFTGTQDELDNIVAEIENYYNELPAEVQSECKDIVFHGKFDELEFEAESSDAFDDVEIEDDFVLPQRTLH